MRNTDKPLIWLHGDIKTPPFSAKARIETGYFLRLLQKGEKLTLPHLRPMPSIGIGCYELRIADENKTFRIVLCLRKDGLIILDVFEKKTNKTPDRVIEICKRRLNRFESDGN